MDPGPTSDPNSPVSIYDHGQLGTVADARPVGRLVEPDEGARTDQETDSIAYDAGSAGGGASAEELAIHETGAAAHGGSDPASGAGQSSRPCSMA